MPDTDELAVAMFYELSMRLDCGLLTFHRCTCAVDSLHSKKGLFVPFRGVYLYLTIYMYMVHDHIQK